MQSQAKTVKEYLDQLPSEQRGELEAVRKVVRKNLPKGYVETMQYSMITYVVPLKIYPTGYLGKKDVPLPYIGLASQKNYLSLYLMNIYGDHKLREAFLKAYKKSGKKLDMGKSCLRFKKAADLSLDVIGEA
ncbi:MAG TPA: DUF1801 domain-containing protein, partial [Flavobacterium sp.]|nr:DUF1801 domain-containing protein [Flavobacterium sp.]